MQEKLNKLIEISGFLRQTEIGEKLLNMKNALEKGECILAVMGQFSAGKSYLINNIIGKTILPVHITETTAAITLIRYGVKEYALLEYIDGRCEEITIEQSLDLWQSGDNNDKLQSVANITVFVDSSLLKNGLVIADTPGINTIISRHMELTYQIIKSSDRVLYVMGKSTTESDLEFAQRISDSGTEIIFIRTHMDDLKESEEKIEDTIEKETKVLKPYTEDKMFFLSNFADSPYYSGVTDLREFLTDTLANDVRGSLEKAVNVGILRATKKLKDCLEERLENLEMLLSNNKAEYDRCRTETEAQLQQMEQILENNKKQLSKKYDRTKQSADNDLENTKVLVIKKIRANILEADENEPEKYREIAEHYIKNGMLSLQTDYMVRFELLLKENSNNLSKQISEIEMFAQIDSDIPDNFETSGVQSMQIAENLENLMNLQNTLDSEIDKLEQKNLEDSQRAVAVNEQLEELRGVSDEIKRQLADYPEYEERYIVLQEANRKNEHRWRNIGSVLDWATIFIPGKGWQTAALKVLKTATNGAKFVKATKIVEGLTKATKKVENATKAIESFDKVTDTVRGAKQLMGSSEPENSERKPSLLDYLSIEYYFGKIGKHFDSPEIKEIDLEYEQEYNKGKKDIQMRLAKIVNEEYKKRVEMQEIKEEQKQRELKRKLIEEKHKQAEKEERELKERLKQSKDKEKQEKLKEFYCNLAEKRIEEFCKHLREDVFEEIDEKVTKYIRDYDFNIVTEITSKRNELKALVEKFESPDKVAIENEVIVCREYSSFLDEVLEKAVTG